MNEVYNKEHCKGSSWAVTAVETSEAALAIKNKKPASNYRISTSYLIHCDNTNAKCNHGAPVRAWNTLKNEYVQAKDYKHNAFNEEKGNCSPT